MKTREQILEIIFNKPETQHWYYPFQKALDDYAKQKSIEFAKWLNKEGWEEYDESDRWICPSNNKNVYTTEHLYKKFTQ